MSICRLPVEAQFAEKSSGIKLPITCGAQFTEALRSADPTVTGEVQRSTDPSIKRRGPEEC